MRPANRGSRSRERFVPRSQGGDEQPAEPAPEPERLPAALVEPAALVIADIQQPSPLPIALSFLADAEEPSLGTVVVGLGRDTYGFGVDRMAPAAELTVALAEGIQEHLAETTMAWGQARPVCAFHAHPASPRVIAGVASWVCPSDGRLLKAIGEAGA